VKDVIESLLFNRRERKALRFAQGDAENAMYLISAILAFFFADFAVIFFHLY